jgi:phage tail sheath gpL-like
VSDKVDQLKSDSKHVTLIKKEDSEQTNAFWSAAFAALNAQYATEPSRPYSTLKVPGIKSSLKSSLTKRNAQLNKRISTYKTNIEDSVFVDRLITTYADPEYRSLEVKQTLSAIRYDLKKYFETRFSRFMLVKEDHPFPGPVLSPKSIKTLLISRYRLWQSQNLVQDNGKVTGRIRVEVSKTNSSKVDIYLPIVTMGQLIISQTQIAFRT